MSKWNLPVVRSSDLKLKPLDYGPQKRPASARQIEAQRRFLENQNAGELPSLDTTKPPTPNQEP
jgi:hypothetical protein